MQGDFIFWVKSPLTNILLRLNAVAVPFVVIVTGKAAAESVPLDGHGLQGVSDRWHYTRPLSTSKQYCAVFCHAHTP